MILRDSRLYPRAQADLAARVGMPGADQDGRILNISLAGLLISGDDQLAGLLSLGSEVKQAAAEQLISFSLFTQELSEVCRVIHVRRLSQSRYEFGLKFVQLSEESEQIIGDYVEQQLR